MNNKINGVMNAMSTIKMAWYSAKTFKKKLLMMIELDIYGLQIKMAKLKEQIDLNQSN